MTSVRYNDMKDLLYDVKVALEKIDALRDKAFFVVLKPYWPRKITPNYITVARIIIAVYLFILLFYYKNASGPLIISLFCVGAFTDLLDGSVARAFGQETDFGAMIDPVADRILIVPIAVYSLFLEHRWLLLYLLILEIINALMSLYGYSKHIFMKSNIFGKIKMFLQSIVFAEILLFWPTPPDALFIDILWLSSFFIIVSIFFKLLYINNIYDSQ